MGTRTYIDDKLNKDYTDEDMGRHVWEGRRGNITSKSMVATSRWPDGMGDSVVARGIRSEHENSLHQSATNRLGPDAKPDLSPPGIGRSQSVRDSRLLHRSRTEGFQRCRSSIGG